MTREDFVKRLEEMKAEGLKSPTSSDLFEKVEGAPGEVEHFHRAMTEYLQRFVIVRDAEGTLLCPCCRGKFRKDSITSILLGATEEYTYLEWGLANGEAHCVKCRWPFRQHHRDVPNEGSFFDMGIAYHPDGIEV